MPHKIRKQNRACTAATGVTSTAAAARASVATGGARHDRARAVIPRVINRARGYTRRQQLLLLYIHLYNIAMILLLTCLRRSARRWSPSPDGRGDDDEAAAVASNVVSYTCCFIDIRAYTGRSTTIVFYPFGGIFEEIKQQFKMTGEGEWGSKLNTQNRSPLSRGYTWNL